MSADRLALSQFVAQRAGFLSEHHVWCLLSEAAHSLSNLLETDPGTWVSGPSLLLSPDTILIGPDHVEYCQGAYNSEIEEHSLFMPPEMSAYKGEELEKGEVEKMYVFSLGMCIMASAMSLQEESDQETELKLADKNLSFLLTRMVEEDSSRRDVTLQIVLDACAAYKETCGEDLSLGALPSAVGGSARSSLSVDVEVVEFEVLDENKDNHIPLSRELDEADSTPPVPSSPPPPRPTSAVIERVNSLDNLYGHIPSPASQVQKRSRFSGMYSRHISASCDDVTLTDLDATIPTVPPDTDTSLLLGVPRPQERPLSTDSTGIPRNVTPAKEYSGDSSSSSSSSNSEVEESGSSTLSEAEGAEHEPPHTPDTLIKLSEEELQKLDALLTRESAHTDSPHLSPATIHLPRTQQSPPLTPTNLSLPSPPTPSAEPHTPPTTQDDVIISLVDAEQTDIIEVVPITPTKESPSPSSPRAAVPIGDSPVMRPEESKGRQRKSETDLLTLSQALEAGSSLPTDTHSGTESGDELTPSLVRKKQGSSRRKMSDHEVFVFEPTYDDEWQHLESREESMKKLKQLLGPDFQRLAGSTPHDRLTDTLTPLKTPTHRREVEVLLLNTRKFVATVEETSLVRDLFLQVVSFLSLQEPSNFSLAVIQRREEVFLDLDLPLFKYAPRGWLDKQADTPLHSLAKRRGRSRRFSVYFRVKFFVENVRLLRSRQTRHLYYLQLRKDLLEGRVSCDEEPSLSLAGLSLQIEVGDFRPEFEEASYYKLGDYLPERVVELVPADTISDTLKQLHKSYQGLSRTEAELAYLKQAQKLPEYGIVYHRASWQKRGQYEEVWAGVSTRGFVLSEMRDTVKVPVLSFSWKLIKLMWYRNKRFVIEPQKALPHPEISFQTNGFKQSNYLLRLSQQFHKFQMVTRGLGSEELSTHYQGDGVSFYSSRGSLSTLHSGKSDPYVPLMDTDVDVLPLPSGLDIPAEPGLKLMSVSLKHASGLGFGLTVILNPPERIPGLYIQHIAENGPAHLDGRLKLYNQILSVNGKPITGSTYKDVLSLLQTSREIEIIVKTECEVVDSVFTMETPTISSKLFGKLERGYEEFEITLKRGVRQDFGFTVEDVQQENGEISVVIREITNRDVAGMLLPGDRILEINSVRLVTFKSEEINIFLETFTDIHILIQRDAPTEEKRISQIEESGYVRMSPDVSPRKMILPPTPPIPPNNASQNDSPYSVVNLSKTRKISPKPGDPSPPPVPPTTLEKFMEPNYLEFETKLKKIDGSLGLNINILTRQPGAPIYVTNVMEGSAAEQSGKILAGDQILSINQQSLTEMNVRNQVKFLGDLPDGETLLFRLRREYIQEEVDPTEEVFEKLEEKPVEASPPSLLDSSTVSVMLTKNTAGGLGIRLRTVNEMDGSVGVYIKEILKGSPASQAEELHPGARIVSLNHQSLTGVDRNRAVSMLKKAASPVIIEIIPDPLMVASELSITASPNAEGDTPLKRVPTDSTLSHESLPGRTPSTLEIMAVLDSPDVREEFFSVPLIRGDRGLGLKVVSKLPDQTGLMIKSVLEDPALSSGMFEVGDEVVAIDGVNIQSTKREDVLARIKGESGSRVLLDMKRYIRIESSTDIQEPDKEGTRPEDFPASLLLNQVSTNSYSRPLPEHNLIEHVFELKLSRGSDEKLGIHLGVFPPEHFPSGIHVKKLTDNSVASADGRLSVDDILLEANGVDLRSISKDEALDIFKQLTGEIQFLVARYAPYSFSSEVLDESEVEVPPLPESAPPPMPLLSQSPDLSLILEQSPADTINTDTIVLDYTSNPPEYSLPSMDSSDSLLPFPSPLFPSLPPPPPPPPDSEPNPYFLHEGVQASRVRLVEPYTQLQFEVYTQEDAQKEIQMINTEMEPESVENDFKEVRLRRSDLPHVVAKLPQNIKKNRSVRTLPFDSNRVILSSPVLEDDYINASVVQLKVNDLEFKYICTQAPPPSEVGNFWQMVWDQELYVIVMLVEQKEYGSRRTYPYWDQAENAELKAEEKMDFGQFSVMLMEESVHDNVVKRGVYVHNKINGERRHILHFTYKSWSGTGIPKSMGDFSSFIEFIRERVMAKEVLVHCHFGIGRTGTFCLVDILSKLVKNRVRADLFQLVVSLNASRMNLIQTTEQYKFGYTALLHLLFERNP